MKKVATHCGHCEPDVLERRGNLSERSPRRKITPRDDSEGLLKKPLIIN